jgi:exosortase
MKKLSRHQAGLAFLWSLSLLVGWRPLAAAFTLAWRDDQFTHILLILPISAALIFMERRQLASRVSLSARSGSAILALSALIALFAWGGPQWVTPDVRLSAGMLSLVVWWIGAFQLCLGSRASRLVLFPLCFLFGVVPFPQFVLDVVIAQLQLGSAWAAHLLFAASGVPVAQDGILLTIPGLTLQVAEECSSIRSSLMLLVTTLVVAHLLLRSPWRKLVVVALAVPLSVAKNGLRIYTLGMLATRVDPDYLTGRLHHQGGILFFAAALLCVFALLWILRRGENPPPTSSLRLAQATAKQD